LNLAAGVLHLLSGLAPAALSNEFELSVISLSLN
jgi:hypothetical protein